MKTFKITLSDNWIYTEFGFFQSLGHKLCLMENMQSFIPGMDLNKVVDINNSRFREIETTGRFFMVREQRKGGQTKIFEVFN